MTLSRIPPSNQLFDKEFIQVAGPDGIQTGFQYDLETLTLFAKESQIIIPSHHGITHVSSDPVPNATTDTPGLLSQDDKAKLDALTGTRLGVLGFAGAGFPDDGGFLQGDIILAAGSEFISIERIGNVVRFTVDIPQQFCACESCAQIFWVQDESDISSIRPPSCSGKLPGVNAYGELKIYQLPDSTIFNPANPIATLGQKINYPALLFKRYPNAITPGLASFDVILQRNSDNTSNVGWSFTPGSTGVPQCVWFMGKDNDGGQIRFDLLPNIEPNLLGAVLYKGHTITRQMAVVTGYSTDVLSTNVYNLAFWDVLGAQPVGDEFQATNVWRYNNPLNSSDDLNDPRSLFVDATKDLLPIGTLVQIWEFQIGTINGERQVRRFFNTDPGLSADVLWGMSDSIRFGDLLEGRVEVAQGTTGEKDACEGNLSDIRVPERTQWGITGFEDPLYLADDGRGTDPLETVLYLGTVASITGNSTTFLQPNGTILLYDSSTNPTTGFIVTNEFFHKWVKFTSGALLGQTFEILHTTDNTIVLYGDLTGAVSGDTFTVYGESNNGQPSGYAINNQFVADDDPTLPGLRVVQTDPMSISERPVYLWHRHNHGNFMVRALVGMPEASQNLFPPIDILLRAPGDSHDDVYVKVIKRGQFLAGPFAGKYYVVVKGPQWRDMPQKGVLRTLTGLVRNENWRFDTKIAFAPQDDDGFILVSQDNTMFLFDDDFGVGTGSGGSYATPAAVTIPSSTTVAQLLHEDVTTQALRLQFSVNTATSAESVQLQFRAGELSMCQPYELDVSSGAIDDLVRGFTPGKFTVSQNYIQQGFITSIENPVVSVPGFKVYTGGFLPVPIDGETERFNELVIMCRNSQLWVWWNRLLITPDPILNAAFATPVVVNTPYFPINSAQPIGKMVFRMWPGATVRQIEVRDQLTNFNEFSFGQLKLSS